MYSRSTPQVIFVVHPETHMFLFRNSYRLTVDDSQLSFPQFGLVWQSRLGTTRCVRWPTRPMDQSLRREDIRVESKRLEYYTTGELLHTLEEPFSV